MRSLWQGKTYAKNTTSPLNLSYILKRGLDLSILKIWGLLVKGLQSYQLSKLEFSRKSLPLRPFHPNCVQSHSARVRTRARSKHFQSLTAGNFEALWSLDFKFSAFKDLFPFSIVSKVQDASSILKVVFALSNRPHLHRAYLVTVW